MTVIRQLKGLGGVMASVRGIVDIFALAPKAIREAVMVGLPDWDPPPPAAPSPPDQETAKRAREVIGMGSVEERRTFDRVMGTWRKITTGAPREPPPAGEPPALPPPRPPVEEAEGES